MAQLKIKCDKANTPITGTKRVLVERLLNPSAHQRKKPKPTPKPMPNNLYGHGVVMAPWYGLHADRGHYLYDDYDYGRDCGVDSEDDDDDLPDVCERCNQSGPRGFIDNHHFMCAECAEACRGPASCPCWRGACGNSCAWCPEEGMWECEA